MTEMMRNSNVLKLYDDFGNLLGSLNGLRCSPTLGSGERNFGKVSLFPGYRLNVYGSPNYQNLIYEINGGVYQYDVKLRRPTNGFGSLKLLQITNSSNVNMNVPVDLTRSIPVNCNSVQSTNLSQNAAVPTAPFTSNNQGQSFIQESSTNSKSWIIWIIVLIIIFVILYLILRK